jgi:hypothetical protein
MCVLFGHHRTALGRAGQGNCGLRLISRELRPYRRRTTPQYVPARPHWPPLSSTRHTEPEIQDHGLKAGLTAAVGVLATPITAGKHTVQPTMSISEGLNRCCLARHHGRRPQPQTPAAGQTAFLVGRPHTRHPGSSPGSACRQSPAVRQACTSAIGAGMVPPPARRPPISRRPGSWLDRRQSSGYARSAVQSTTLGTRSGPEPGLCPTGQESRSTGHRAAPSMRVVPSTTHWGRNRMKDTRSPPRPAPRAARRTTNSRQGRRGK